MDDGGARQAAPRQRQGIDEQIVGWHGKILEGQAHGLPGSGHDTHAVDLLGGRHAHADAQRDALYERCRSLPLGRGQLLAVAYERKVAVVVVVQGGQHHGGGHDGAGQGAASDLIHPCDHAEALITQAGLFMLRWKPDRGVASGHGLRSSQFDCERLPAPVCSMKPPPKSSSPM